MRRRRHLLERKYGQLAEGEKPVNAGNDVAQTCRQLEIAESPTHRWQNQRGAASANDTKRLMNRHGFRSGPLNGEQVTWSGRRESNPRSQLGKRMSLVTSTH